jgi:allantoin racemase
VIADRVLVPLIGGVEAAVLQAETLVRLGARKATEGSFRRPPLKPAIGLSPALTKLLDWS